MVVVDTYSYSTKTRGSNLISYTFAHHPDPTKPRWSGCTMGITQAAIERVSAKLLTNCFARPKRQVGPLSVT